MAAVNATSKSVSRILGLRDSGTWPIVTVTPTLGRRTPYLKATTMPDSISDPQPAPTPPPRLSVDLFFDRVIQSVHRHEARAQRAERLTGLPYRYNLSSTASFTGLPLWRLRRLCRQGKLQAFKFSGWWLVHRDEFMRLLDPASTLQWRTNRERQQIFLDNLQDLAAMLHPCEVSCTIQVLLKDLRRAVQARREGAAYDEAEGYAWARAEWRVRYGLVDPSQMEEALRLLETIVRLGMPVFERIIWHAEETAAMVAMLRDQAGVEVWL